MSHTTPWDLAVIGFERRAWIEAVLAARAPSLERYLATLAGDV